MASNVLPLFWPLANSSKDTRLTASANLVSSLENFQRSYAVNGTTSIGGAADEDDSDDESGEEVDEDEDDESGMEVDASDDEGRSRDVQGEKLDRQLARNNAEDVVYSVKRLVRGLASSRDSSRLGFAVALTELLSRIHTVTAAQVYSLVIRNSHYSKQMKGADERDMMFARLFGLTAIVQSNALFASSSTAMDFSNIIQQLIQLGNGKAWIRESAWWTVVGAVQGLLASDVEWKNEALKELLDNIFEDKLWTQEKVALVLLLEGKVPNFDWKSHLAPTFKHTPLLNSHNLVTLSRILKEAPAEDDEGASTSAGGSWKPQLHFVWNIILDHYFVHGNATANEAPFQDLFRVVVDESLFSNTSSSQRKYWGFQVFERALPLLPQAQMPLIFTPNFMRSWMNNLSSADRYLHKAALQIAKRVQEVTKENPKVGFTLLSQLVGKHGRPDFDKITKTKTVESIMGSLNAEGANEYVEYLQGIIINASQENLDAALIDERRSWALDQLQALCRNGSIPKDDAWVSSTLDFLLLHGFFIIRKADKKSAVVALHSTPKPALSEVTATACRSRFFSCLVELTTASVSQRGGDDSNKPQRRQGSDGSGELWLQRALETVSALEADHKHVELSTDADEEIKSIRKAALATLAVLRQSTQGDAEVRRGVEIMLAFFVLQTYDEVEDALDLLEEVNGAAQKIFNLPSPLGSTSEDDEEEVAPIDALLDVLIALLDKNSSDLRSLANLVFGMVSSAFTKSSLSLLSAQLEQTPASAAAAEEDDADEDEDEEVGEGSDEQENEEDEESSAEEEDDDEDDDEDDLPPVDPAFRQRVAEALQVAGMGLDENEEDDDSDDESEEHWDDEQMMKVDEQLAAVFRQQASTTKRTDLKHLQIESLHFKNRVLDFFDTYAKQQLTNPLVLEVALALLRLVRVSGSSEGELANKAAGILKTRFNKPKDVPSTADLASSSKALSEIHEMGQKASSAEFSSLCSLCSLFVVRTIDAAASSETAKSAAVDAYRSTLADFMTRKSSLVRPNFILDFIRRFPLRAFALHTDLITYLAPGGGVNVYRQLQAYAMLQTLSQHMLEISKSIPSTQVQSFIRSTSETIFATVESAASTADESSQKTSWNGQRLKEVLKFALALARTSKSLSVQWDQKRIQEVLETIEKSERLKSMRGLHGLLKQLSAILNKGQGEKLQLKGKRKQTEDQDVEMDDGEQSLPAAVAPDKAEEEGKKAKKAKSDVKEDKEKAKKRKSVAGDATTVKSKKKKDVA